jgi:two-component system sensor histidine kinase BarA
MDDATTFDWELCLTQCNNNEALAKELFGLFLAELPEYKQKIMDAQMNTDKKSLLDSIHKLHGACCYIGVPKLRNLVAEAETVLKQKTQKINLEDVAEILAEIEKIENISQPEKYHG